MGRYLSIAALAAARRAAGGVDQPVPPVAQTDTRLYRRPSVEDVARELFRVHAGKSELVWPPAGVEWGQLKETATILPTGRRSFYLQTVNAVYAAMDRAEALTQDGSTGES